MWGDTGAPQEPYVPPSSAAVNRSLDWKDSSTAQAKTFAFVASRLNVPSISDEQKEQVRFLFRSTRVDNEASWRPEVFHTEKLNQAVERCRWFSDAAFRLKVYGEFAQILNPHLNFVQLPMLLDYQKNEAKSFYLSSLLDHRFTSQAECMKDALARFGQQYASQLPEFDRRRIESERAVRWNERQVSYPESERAQWNMDGWR